MPTVPKRRGRKPQVPLAALLASLVVHFMNRAGTLAEHFAMLFEDGLNDSSCADRRGRLPWQVFADLMARGLRPLAQQAHQSAAFYRHWRLVALDGTQFSLFNTPANNTARRKAKSRRGRAALAKLTTGVLVELGLHNPLAAAIGQEGQSEWRLALGLWTSLLDPQQAPADELARLYTQRWEHELYYHHLKHELRKTELLQSHTVPAAAQEIDL